MDEWHELVSHAGKNLSASYLKTWGCIFGSGKAHEGFKSILILVEICFCLPYSNAQLERSSRMKRIKTSRQRSLGSERLENQEKIVEEGVEFKNVDATTHLYAWVYARVRRPNQCKEKRNYQKHISAGDKNNISELVSLMTQNLKVLVKKTLTKKLTFCLIKTNWLKCIAFW